MNDEHRVLPKSFNGAIKQRTSWFEFLQNFYGTYHQCSYIWINSPVYFVCIFDELSQEVRVGGLGIQEIQFLLVQYFFLMLVIVKLLWSILISFSFDFFLNIFINSNVFTFWQLYFLEHVINNHARDSRIDRVFIYWPYDTLKDMSTYKRIWKSVF